ncbi:MAG: CoA-binding protein [Actinomycetota bacterium]|nr:CoA-binding protein [Actinomycetota bacterium]
MPTELVPLAGNTRARSLSRMLAPRSVAVTGTLQQHGHTGHEVLRALRDYRFRGRLYPVHESGRPVCGIPGYRTIADLPAAPDLIVVAADGYQAVEAVRAAGRRGIAGAVVLGVASAREGYELQQVARHHSVRLFGPGSFGLLNTDPRVRLNATLSRARPPRGGLALVSQSGAVGAALLDHVARNGCGVSGFVSTGDRQDLDINGLMTFWRDDARTRALALFPDALDDPRRLADQARSFSRRKPILQVVGGGQEAIVAGSLLADAGVICTSSPDEMTDAARVLVSQPLPTGNRLAIVGNAGGLTAMAARTANAYGFSTPCGAGERSMDTTAGSIAADLAAAVESVAETRQADLILALAVGTRANCPTAIMTALAEALDRIPGLTAAVVLAGTSDDIHRVGISDTPVYRQPDRAIRALAHARRYAMWRRRQAHDEGRRVRAERP